MENLQLIMVTVLITLISGALVGSLIYLGVVVRKLRQTIKENVVDIINLQNNLNNEGMNIYNRIDEVEKSLYQKLEQLYTSSDNNYSELDRKIDSRYDKLVDNISRDMELLRKTK